MDLETGAASAQGADDARLFTQNHQRGDQGVDSYELYGDSWNSVKYIAGKFLASAEGIRMELRNRARP